MSTFAWVKTMAGSTQSGAYAVTTPPPSPLSPPSPYPAGLTKPTLLGKPQEALLAQLEGVIDTDTTTSRVIAHTLESTEVMAGTVILTGKAFTDAVKRQYFEGLMVMTWKRDRAKWIAKEGLSDEVRASFSFLDTTFALLPKYGRAPTPQSSRSKHSETSKPPKSHQPAPEV